MICLPVFCALYVLIFIVYFLFKTILKPLRFIRAVLFPQAYGTAACYCTNNIISVLILLLFVCSLGQDTASCNDYILHISKSLGLDDRKIIVSSCFKFIEFYKNILLGIKFIYYIKCSIALIIFMWKHGLTLLTFNTLSLSMLSF